MLKIDIYNHVVPQPYLERLKVLSKDGEMTRAVFAAPVRGRFHFYAKASAVPGGGGGVKTLNQLVLESLGGPLTVEGDTATVEGSVARPVRVQRTVPDAQGRPVGDPMTITTIHLTLTTTTAFGAPNSGLKNLVATGPGTTIEAGSDSAVGDTIRYELPAGGQKGALGSEGVLRITSVDGTVRVRQRGSMLEGYDVMYDLASGRISARVKRADVKSSK